MKLLFDIETDGLLDTLTKVHCIALMDVDTRVVLTFDPTSIEQGLKALMEADELIGHNIMGFDIPALLKVYPDFKPPKKLTDTLVLSRLIWPNLRELDFKKEKIPRKSFGSHSLEAWGYRLKCHKGDFGQDTDWSVTGRLEYLLEGSWSQFNQMTSPPGSEKGVLWGIAAHAQNGERTGQAGRKQDQVGVTSDISIHMDGMTFFASGTFHNQKNLAAGIPNGDWVGYVVQASTYMTDTTEYFIRYEGGGVIQDSLGNNDVNILTNGINWYLDGQGLKVTSDFGWSFGEISNGSNGAPSMSNNMVGWRTSVNQNAEWLFRTQLQLAF